MASNNTMASKTLARIRPGTLAWAIPTLILAMGTAAAWVFDLDRSISRLFYAPGALSDWPLARTGPARFLYDWGEVPAVLIGMGACLMIAWAARRRPHCALKRAGLVLLIGLILGPLVLTNGILKSYYGRPRPQQIVEFGGERPFQPVLWPTFDPKENSFPSGHAAAGFALMLPCFVLYRRRPFWASASLGLGLTWGAVMGAVRIAQGGHFFSDVLWSAGVVYFSAYAAAAWIEAQEARAPATGWSGRKVLVVRGAALAACVLIGLIYLARLPFQASYEWVVPLEPGARRANIELVTRNGTAQLVEMPESREVRVLMTAQGRGLPLDPVDERQTVLRPRPDGPRVRYTFLPTWSTINFSSRIVVQAPPGVKLSIRQPSGKPISFMPPQAAEQASPDE